MRNRDFNDICNQRFGKLTVTEFLGNIPNGAAGTKRPFYRCQCDCGTEATIARHSIINGRSQSCGCTRKHYCLGAPKKLVRTGKSKTPEYTAWIRLRRSCNDKDYKDYVKYGARGISVCDEWLHDFEAFLSHVGQRPSATHSIDRIDNNGNYEPGNVRWATKTEQSRNRRNTVVLTFDGETKTLCEWAEHFGLTYHAMKMRYRNNWTMERIKATPLLRQK